MPQNTNIVKNSTSRKLERVALESASTEALMLELGSKNLKISELLISFEKLEKQWNKLKESETREVIHILAPDHRERWRVYGQ